MSYVFKRVSDSLISYYNNNNKYVLSQTIKRYCYKIPTYLLIISYTFIKTTRTCYIIY